MSGRWTVLIVTLVGAGALLAGGCVSTEQYNEALRAQRMARESLEKSQNALQAARVDNHALQTDLAGSRQQLDAKNEYIGKLEQGNNDLTDRFDRLKKLYDKLAGRDVTSIGSVVVLPAPLDAALKMLQSQNPELMDYLPQYGMVKLKSDLTFAKGSAVVADAADTALRKLAEIMNTQDGKAFHVYAAGHTDDMPLVNRATIEAHGSNWGLSLHRAGAVVKVLALAGVDQKRLGAVGFSKYHPVAANAPGNKGNPANRRVEIWIVPPDRLLTAGVGGVEPAGEPEK